MYTVLCVVLWLCSAVLFSILVSVLCGIMTVVVGSEVLCLCGVVMWLLTELYH